MIRYYRTNHGPERLHPSSLTARAVKKVGSGSRVPDGYLDEPERVDNAFKPWGGGEAKMRKGEEARVGGDEVWVWVRVGWGGGEERGGGVVRR